MAQQENHNKKAFLLGVAFCLGAWFAQNKNNLAQDALIFRTLKNGVKIAIKDGEVVGGAGSAVGPDKLPTFDNYANQERFKGVNSRKIATKYMQEHYQKGIKEVKLSYPLKFGDLIADKVVFTGNSCKETVAKINPDKLKILPYIAELYRTGIPQNVKKDLKSEKHNSDGRAYGYVENSIKVNGKLYKVTLVARFIQGQSLQHYAIGKADLTRDAKQKNVLEFVDLKIK